MTQVYTRAPGLSQAPMVGAGVQVGHSASHTQIPGYAYTAQTQVHGQVPPTQLQQIQHIQRQQMMAATPNAIPQQQMSYQQQYQLQQQQYQQAYERQQAQLQQQQLYATQQERQLVGQGLASQQSRLVANRARFAEEAKLQRMRLEASRNTPAIPLRQQVYRFSEAQGDQLGLGIGPPEMGIGVGGGSMTGVGLAPLGTGGSSTASLPGPGIPTGETQFIGAPQQQQQQQQQLLQQQVQNHSPSQGQLEGRASRLPGREVTTGVVLAAQQAQQAQQMKQITPLQRKPVMSKKSVSAQLMKEHRQHQLMVQQQQQILKAKLGADAVDPSQEKMLKDLFPGWFG